MFPHIGPPPLLDELDELLLDDALDALDELLLEALDADDDEDVMPLDEDDDDDDDVVPLDEDELVSPLDDVELDVVLPVGSLTTIVPSSSKAQAETNAPTVRANPEMVKMANDLEYWRI